MGARAMSKILAIGILGSDAQHGGMHGAAGAGATSRLVPGGPERLFGLLATRAIRPRVAERISFDEVAEAHRRLEAAVLRAVLCPDLPSRRDRVRA